MQAAFVVVDLVFLALAWAHPWAVRLPAAVLLVPMAVGVGLARSGGGWLMLVLWLLAGWAAVRCGRTPARRQALRRWIAEQDARSAAASAQRSRWRAAAHATDPNEAASLWGSAG